MRSWTLILCLVIGCSYPSPQTTVPVRGTVVSPNGKPPTSGWVVFHPRDLPGNEAYGKINKDGSFRLGTFGAEDGAVVGRYIITVGPPPGIQGREKETIRAGIPKRYWKEETSPLSHTVQVGSDSLILQLK